MIVALKNKNHDNDISSYAISLATNSDWIHAVIILGNDMVASSWTNGGVQYRKLEDVVKVKRHFSFFDVNFVDMTKAINLIEQNLGKPFDYKGLLMLGKNIKPKNSSFFCSEFCTFVLKNSVYQNNIFAKLTPEETTPGMLYDLLKKNC